MAFAAFADEVDRDDLFAVFTGALLERLVPPPGWEVELNFRRSKPGAKARREAVTTKVPTKGAK
jgi:hypothetical protein